MCEVSKVEEEKYQKIVSMHRPKVPTLRNTFLSFLSGGLIGTFCEGMNELAIHVFQFEKEDASFFATMMVVLVASSLTFFGVYNNISQKCGAGLFLPTSGFANSLTSSAMEGRSEGLIGGIGSMMYSLAGSVLTYGYFIAFYFATIYFLLNLWGINPWH